MKRKNRVFIGALIILFLLNFVLGSTNFQIFIKNQTQGNLSNCRDLNERTILISHNYNHTYFAGTSSFDISNITSSVKSASACYKLINTSIDRLSTSYMILLFNESSLICPYKNINSQSSQAIARYPVGKFNINETICFDIANFLNMNKGKKEIFLSLNDFSSYTEHSIVFSGKNASYIKPFLNITKYYSIEIASPYSGRYFANENINFFFVISAGAGVNITDNFNQGTFLIGQNKYTFNLKAVYNQFGLSCLNSNKMINYKDFTLDCSKSFVKFDLNKNLIYANISLIPNTSAIGKDYNILIRAEGKNSTEIFSPSESLMIKEKCFSDNNCKPGQACNERGDCMDVETPNTIFSLGKNNYNFNENLLI